MNAFESIIEDLNTTTFDLMEKGLKPIEELHQTVANYLKRINNIIEEYQKSGTLPDISVIENWEDSKNDHLSVNKKSGERSSHKENVKPQETLSPPKSNSPPRARPRRNAFKEASQNINQQITAPLNTKLRRPQDVSDNFQNVYVKVEKLSICNTDSSKPELPQIDQVKVKTEIEEMPAPTRPAPKKKKRKGDSKIQIKQEKIEELEKINRDSDIVLKDVTVTVVNLVDSLNDDEKRVVNENVEEKRNTKVINESNKMKRSRSYSLEDEVKESREKRSKSLQDDNEMTLKEMSKVNDATFIAKPVNTSKPQQNMNVTVVIENPKYVENFVPASVSDMMTDDESLEEVHHSKNSPKSKSGIPKFTKQIFSPFEQSPVKKKVQAFEKLKDEANAMPPRITRTKTRAQAKEKSEADALEEAEAQKSNVKEKAKIFTPTASKFIPKAVSTTIKSSKVNSSSNESLLSGKSASALKASQVEYREREKKRREKEQEVLKKRDALLQAQTEEKKRKREEKQLKAQQQREALEKEKLKVLEAQRLKDERHKRLLAEQEEKKQKQKEELDKKRLLAKMRALEEKKKEEEKRIEEQKRAEELTAKLAKQDVDMARMLEKQKLKQTMPIYMRTRTPELPTPDCYDSDDERCTGKDFTLPDWLSERNLKFMQKCACAAGDSIKNTFFSIQAQTPDLQDIFEVIEPRKLKRSSSAMWHKPPRFTMVPPALEDHNETDDFDDDD